MGWYLCNLLGLVLLQFFFFFFQILVQNFFWAFFFFLKVEQINFILFFNLRVFGALVKTNLFAPVAPTVYKPAGRPPMKRKKDADEPNNSYKVSRSYKPIKCGFCHHEGHNSRRRKVRITGETPWQRRQKLERQKNFVSKAKMCSL